MKFNKILIFFLIIFLFSCSGKNNNITEHSKANNIEKKDSIIVEKNPAEYELKDSIKLRHIKNEFYRNKYGFLYEKTLAQKEYNGHLKDVVYFNGVIAQEIDPNSFQQIDDSWYAKDNENVYYYRPTRGGMIISIIDNVDIHTFKIIEGYYRYAVDKNSFYYENEKIKGFIPGKTELINNKNGKVIKLKMRNNELILEA